LIWFCSRWYGTLIVVSAQRRRDSLKYGFALSNVSVERVQTLVLFSLLMRRLRYWLCACILETIKLCVCVCVFWKQTILDMYYYGPSQKDVNFIIGSNVATSTFLTNLNLTSSVANELMWRLLGIGTETLGFHFVGYLL
jgi:hypothetical protein